MIENVDPAGENPLVLVVFWIEGALLGNIATAVAVITIASVGFLMVTGRIDTRRAARVVFGCFIIFGASTIAGGILGAIQSGRGDSELAQAPPPPPPVPLPPAIPQATNPYDPYAGAALPPR